MTLSCNLRQVVLPFCFELKRRLVTQLAASCNLPQVVLPFCFELKRRLVEKLVASKFL
jgi:predicted DsbA family dithiol-disulfide isomerase